MAKPAPKPNPRVLVNAMSNLIKDTKLRSRVEEFRANQRPVLSVSEAMRRLLDQGLKANKF